VNRVFDDVMGCEIGSGIGNGVELIVMGCEIGIEIDWK
jgi:hypothetical protein